MNEFRTVIESSAQKSFVGLHQSVFTIGSCFADGIGKHLYQSKINTLVNPFGTVYNPISIHKLLDYAVHRKPVSSQSFIQHNDIFLNYDFHSEFSAIVQNDLSERLEQVIQSSHQFIKNADVLIVTYGTSWVYERKDSGEIVANCHKIPAQNFTKFLLTPEKIITSFETVYHDLKKLNPSLKIILTVSPVRHTRDTLALNCVSKSILRFACHVLSSSLSDVDYFPAYEIMMDDLRDYRFFKADMIHPSDVAEEYIWQKFIDTYADDAFRKFLPEWNVVKAALSHRPFHPSSTAHQRFLKDILKKLEAIKSTVNVDVEINLIKDQIIH